MNNSSRDGFDRKGIAFVAKASIIITLLIVSTKFVANSAAVFLLSVPENTALAETVRNVTASAVNVAGLYGISDGVVDSSEEASAPEVSGLTSKIEQARGATLTDTTPPHVSAASYIVADINTGQVYAEKNANEVRPIASISKLMTALVASNSIHQDREIVVTNNAASTYGNMAKFSAGEKMSASDMLYPMLLYSANDAAISIGDNIVGDFKTLMNREARSLGMAKTNFVEPSGLSAQNVSTSSDLFKLAQYIHHHKRDIFDLTRTEAKTIQTSHDSYNFRNIHQLRHIEGYVGGKNGYISASGRTLLSLFEIKDNQGDMRTVAIIVLGSEDSTSDSLKLLSWIRKAL